MSVVMESAAAHPSECANCATSLNGSFCHTCGQRAHLHKSLLHLGEEVLHGVLHFDAKGLRTLPMLVARPGELTRRYVDGHRTRFVSPLALFLFMVVVMFFVASVANKATVGTTSDSIASFKAQLDADIARDKARITTAKAALTAAKAKGGDVSEEQEEVDDALAMLNALESSSKDIVFPADGKNKKGGFIGKTGWKQADAALAHANENPELTIYKFMSSGAKYSFLLVPISLPFLWLLFWRRRDITMYDHAVFSLYSLSFMALMFSVLFILWWLTLGSLAWWMLVCVPPVHMFLQLRGTYTLGRWSAVWRTSALTIVAGTVLLLYLALILTLSIK